MQVNFRTLLEGNDGLQPRWTAGKRVRALTVALLGVALIAALDYSTGYEIRLAILYILPIAFATWHGGVVAGWAIAAAAVLSWGMSFHPAHVYSRDAFYIWEGCVLAATFALFIHLLAQLRIALHNADTRFRNVLDGLSASVYAVGERSGRVLYANRSLSDLIGEDSLGKSASLIGARLKPAVPNARVSRNPAPDTPFAHHEARDEQSGRWYLIQSGSIPWQSGEQARLHVLMDITEQKQAAALRRQHQEMLHDTARLAVLAEIATMLGHEINQPLMAVATYTTAGTMLLSNPQPDVPQALSALEKALAQVTRASDIIERTRSFLMRRSPTMSDADINAVVRQAVQALEPALHELPFLQLQWHLQEDLPALLFDPILIEQVIVNLVSNAIDAVRTASNAEARIEISTSLRQEGVVEITVADDGPGLSQLKDGELYTPFFTTKPNGVGLGLSICQSIVEAHAGRLWHTPNGASGAVFHFTLPILDQHEANRIRC